MFLLYHVYVYLEFLILACTIYILAPESVNNIDNGWRFLSEIDTDEFLADSKNMVICDWGTIFEIEPAIAPIFELPIGTELTLEYDGSQKYFVKSETGEKLIF